MLVASPWISKNLNNLIDYLNRSVMESVKDQVMFGAIIFDQIIDQKVTNFSEKQQEPELRVCKVSLS